MFKSDIEIAQAANMLPITEVAANFGVDADHLENYGKHKAKVSYGLMDSLKNKPNGKLVLVTAINPTPAGEGKSTTTIGLAQGLNLLGRKAVVALREPSLGPCMGVKGGAAGGGYAQVVPMEDINLHFTGDFHAIGAANNLLSAMIDNHLQQGNTLNIDPRQIAWKRCVDMNDRALRQITVGLGGKANGIPREDGFQIVVASEVMAILCLADGLVDLKERLGEIIIGYTYDNKPVYCKDLSANNAMAALLKDAIKPNLVQTLENTLAVVHGGPFANIAHGCNSVAATKLALKLGDVTVTEAGFGADLGAEKFFDIKCRKAGLSPDAVVIVSTIRALKYNGGVELANLGQENLDALTNGFANLERHISNLKKFGVPVVVALNAFNTDTEAERELVRENCQKLGVDYALSEVWGKGGEGGRALAERVINILDNKPSDFKFLYEDELSPKDKITKICKDIYGASNVNFSQAAKNTLARVKRLGLNNLPVCMAKTQVSFSDNPALLGAPTGFEVTVREIRISAGAGFLVAVCGEIMTMPGLPKVPSAEKIDVDASGNVTGLF